MLSECEQNNRNHRSSASCCGSKRSRSGCSPFTERYVFPPSTASVGVTALPEPGAVISASAAEEWTKAREAIDKEENATDEVKNEAIQTKANEDCCIADKRMPREAFEQVVEAVLPLGSMRSFLAMQNATEDEAPEIPAALWLQAFAEALVEE